jgi:drug/metabolite transporter (DMT)-like permease
MYLGAVLLTLPIALATTDFSALTMTTKQGMALLYLGVIASGLCFYLWNSGSKQVNTATLATMNNAYIPLAVLFAFSIFGESIHWPRFIVGSTLITLGVILARKQQNRT